MLAVAGRPFLAHVLDQLSLAHLDEIVLAVSFQWEKIQAEIGNRWRGVKISYSIEQSPLGTGGAIRQAMQQAGIIEALVANGDTLLNINADELIQFARDHEADIAIALRANEDTSRFGKVRINSDNRIVAFEEKAPASSGLINSGMYFVKSSIFSKMFTQAFSFEKDILVRQTDLLAIYGMQTSAYFIDMGIPEDLARAHLELSTMIAPPNA